MLKRIYNTTKRIFDVCVSCTGLVVLSPLFGVISLLVKMDSHGPVFFVHKRVGLHGEEIGVYKFRTMKQGAERLEDMLSDGEIEEYYREFKLDKDPRITGFGAFLRRSSLDELPQLINILKGEMSLIGPRPLIAKEFMHYTEEQKEELLSVVPGLTGYWQAYARNTATYQTGERQAMELYYAENASIGLDVKIFFKTFGAVFSGRGAK